MYITKEELNTHLLDESIIAISGDDDTIITAAIDGAVAEAKGYLHKWDRAAEFARTDEERNPLLVIFVKDIAVWHYINIATPGIEMKVRQDRYRSAVQWLKDVQAGLIVPDLPELPPVEGQAGTFAWGSNPARSNHI